MRGNCYNDCHGGNIIAEMEAEALTEGVPKQIWHSNKQMLSSDTRTLCVFMRVKCHTICAMCV